MFIFCRTESKPLILCDVLYSRSNFFTRHNIETHGKYWQRRFTYNWRPGKICRLSPTYCSWSLKFLCNTFFHCVKFEQLDPCCLYENITSILKFEPKFNLCGGINLPKIVMCIGSDGVKRRQLIKVIYYCCFLVYITSAFKTDLIYKYHLIPATNPERQWLPWITS